MLDTTGTVWVTDFGLAKLDEQGELTRTGDIVGTLRYMAPERFQGESDGRSDIYSLGLTLYELITLKPAFRETDRHQLIERVTQRDVPRPRKINPQIPRDLETIVLKAIGREPPDRYQTPADLKHDLERFLDDKPIQARQASPPERLWRWARRNPAVASLTSVVAVLLLTVAVVSSLSSRRLREKHEDVLANLQRAIDAERDARESAVREREARELATRRLFEASLATSDLVRRTGHMGQRFDSLGALAEAAKLVPTQPLPHEALLDVRNRAIASMPLVDVRPDRLWPGHAPASDRNSIAFDMQVARYARTEPGGDIVVRRMSDNERLFRLPALGDLDNPPYLRFSPDGHLLAVKSHDLGGLQLVQIWHLQSEKTIFQSLAGGEAGDTALDFSPDGRRLALNEPDGDVGIYDLESGQRLVEFPTDMAATYMRFSPTGSKLAFGVSSKIFVQDADGPNNADLSWEHSHEANALA